VSAYIPKNLKKSRRNIINTKGLMGPLGRYDYNPMTKNGPWEIVGKFNLMRGKKFKNLSPMESPFHYCGNLLNYSSKDL